MKERTEIDIQNLYFTYAKLASCRVYDDAKVMLNELVTAELGREYGDEYDFDEGADEWLCKEIKYKNSIDSHIVKLAIIDAMTHYLDAHDLISEEGTIGFVQSKVIDSSIIPFKRMDNDAKKVREWLERWKTDSFLVRSKEGYQSFLSYIGTNGNPIDHYNALVKNGRLDKTETPLGNWLAFCGKGKVKEEFKINIHGNSKDINALYYEYFRARTPDTNKRVFYESRTKFKEEFRRVFLLNGEPIKKSDLSSGTNLFSSGDRGDYAKAILGLNT